MNILYLLSWQTAAWCERRAIPELFEGVNIPFIIYNNSTIQRSQELIPADIKHFGCSVVMEHACSQMFAFLVSLSVPFLGRYFE